ncbi:helix-turn-helix domain-containing protein [Mucilaginibacter litoreus]|uniref:Helix-turn-helix domain-containing protein n=1 Tax=Mucilaginibacter litoreus TaxID=1048221 RepID=A0ABW3ATR2_9SPHI
MEHFGQIVEKVIRRDGYSISELARLTNVNRRSVYNWFKQKRLRPEIIYRIGLALNYDFSKDFPTLFNVNEFKNIKNSQQLLNNSWVIPHEEKSESYWKDRYISLLEKYNDLLRSNVQNLTQNSKVTDTTP